MIRTRENGTHYCDGRECGYPLAWQDCAHGEGAECLVTCVDCGSSMYVARDKSANEVEW